MAGGRGEDDAGLVVEGPEVLAVVTAVPVTGALLTPTAAQAEEDHLAGGAGTAAAGSPPAGPLPSRSPRSSLRWNDHINTAAATSTSARAATQQSQQVTSHGTPSPSPPGAPDPWTLSYRDARTGLEIPSPLQLFLWYDSDG